MNNQIRGVASRTLLLHQRNIGLAGRPNLAGGRNPTSSPNLAGGPNLAGMNTK